MIRIFANKNNTPQNKRFIFPKDEIDNSTNGIEIVSDLEKKEFFAKSINLSEIEEDENWVLYNDNTFPSSLFREFLEQL